MHPAFSVLFFTVTSGFGYGLMLWLIIARVTGFLTIDSGEFITASALAALLFTAGLLSSTLHLANPKNAWRSFMRFRTSWLSREGVFAVVAYPVLMLFVYLAWSQQMPLLLIITALVAFLLIVALLYCTAMIYASLKTIPQWHNALVAPLFIVYAFSSGGLVLSVFDSTKPGFLYLNIAMLVCATVLKLRYFKEIGKPTKSNINTATSFSQAKVSLFDSGHSHENFLQREFVYLVGEKTTKLARAVSLTLAFVAPVLCILIVVANPSWAGLLWFAVLSNYLGLLLERWLFFIEAKHVVRHYYAQ